MRVSEKEAKRYEKELGAKRYYLMRMHCGTCRAVAGAVVSTQENPRPLLVNIGAVYLCANCMNNVLNNIQKHNLPFNDKAMDRFEEEMK